MDSAIVTIAGRPSGIAATARLTEISRFPTNGVPLKNPNTKYCSKKIAGICFEYKEGYCVFNDYIAYDVQAHGRDEQLGISFGSGENPDCRGLTVSEIQSINFSKIDFSNYYTMYQNNTKFPDRNQISQAIQNDINKQIRGR